MAVWKFNKRNVTRRHYGWVKLHMQGRWSTMKFVRIKKHSSNTVLKVKHSFDMSDQHSSSKMSTCVPLQCGCTGQYFLILLEENFLDNVHTKSPGELTYHTIKCNKHIDQCVQEFDHVPRAIWPPDFSALYNASRVKCRKCTDLLRISLRNRNPQWESGPHDISSKAEYATWLEDMIESPTQFEAALDWINHGDQHSDIAVVVKILRNLINENKLDVVIKLLVSISLHDLSRLSNAKLPRITKQLNLLNFNKPTTKLNLSIDHNHTANKRRDCEKD